MNELLGGTMAIKKRTRARLKARAFLLVFVILECLCLKFLIMPAVVESAYQEYFHWMAVSIGLVALATMKMIEFFIDRKQKD